MSESTRRHMHRPWRIDRWVECGGGWVAWELFTAVCPHCPECHGEGGRWTSGPDGDDPDMDACGRCSSPVVDIRIPAWMDWMIPRSPTRPRAGHMDVEPPF